MIKYKLLLIVINNNNNNNNIIIIIQFYHLKHFFNLLNSSHHPLVLINFHVKFLYFSPIFSLLYVFFCKVLFMKNDLQLWSVIVSKKMRWIAIGEI